MSAMKDITNYRSDLMQSRQDNSPERDIFVSFATSSSRKPGTQQSTLQRFYPETAGSDSNEQDRSCRSESEADEELNSVFLTPETPNNSHQKVNGQKRKRLRLGGSPRNNSSAAASGAISVTLNGLSKAQLVDLVNKLVFERHPDLQQELQELIPEPDLSELDDRLHYLQRNIFKSFPHTRYGSSRDAFCYRRVNTHLNAFKKECLSQGENLLASQLWQPSVNYVLMAWSYVEGMPDWDNPSHNKSKEQCFKSLAVQCKKALTKLRGSLTREKCSDLLSRMKVACEKNAHLQPCMEDLRSFQAKI